MKGKRLKVKGIFILFFLSIFNFQFSICYAQIGMQELGDSLTAWTGFSRVWSPAVRIKQMRVSGSNVTLYTNNTLRDVRWTPENVKEIKQKISLWTLGHPDAKVTLYAGRTDIESLITDCARLTAESGLTAKRSNSASDLTDRKVILYPSHGLYFNRDRQEWIWQRATLWTTVEDLYSQEYVRLIKRMIENAGGTVLMPRAGIDQVQPGLSGMPQWTEGARYWLQNQGADSALWDLYEGNEYKDDMKCRAMWVNAQTTPIDLCLAFHTDGLDSGDDTTIVGTLAIYTAKDDDGHTVLRNGKDREKANRNLADWIQTTVTEDLRHIAPEWTRRQLKEANYCETRVPVVPSIILELLSHKNMADMKYGLDPKFRFAASRAVYKGILRYLNGPDAVVQPLPVQDLGISADGLLQWKAPTDSIEPSAKPSYYMVYSQANDGEWDVQQVESAQMKVSLTPGTRYSFYVIAGNDGGLSFPSPVISAYLSNSPKDGLTAEGGLTAASPGSNSAAVLIVDAFNDVYGPEWFADSTYAGIVPGTYACENYLSCAYIGEQWNFTRNDPWTNDDNCGWGACYRDHAGQLTVGNTHDYIVQHGRVLQQMNLSYVSCTAGMMEDNEAVLQAKPVLIDFICGRNRVPLNINSQLSIVNYLASGCRLLLSSDHLSALDPAWTKSYLHASYYAAHATRSGRIMQKGENKPFRIALKPNEEQLFTCHPEGLKPEGASVWATYTDMRVPAAVSTPSTLVFGFPLESARNFELLYQHAIKALMEE